MDERLGLPEIRLTSELKQSFEIACIVNKVSRSEAIRQALEQWIQAQRVQSVATKQKEGAIA